ncbi:hypothetical protein KsCSTR_08530 [Candidatus Kuenenia stuttgartiensis]|nr:hypothetical protein KsCSTR_08530 [Candidatus Kuenenia stuttgartiensis]
MRVQVAIKRAVQDAKICKRVATHTFRRSFATYLMKKAEPQ